VRAILRTLFKVVLCSAVLAPVVAAALWMYLQAGRAMDLSDLARARKDGRPIPVRTAKVETVTADQVVGGTAVTEPSEQAVVRIDFSGRKSNDPPTDIVLAAVHARDGDRVEKGQLLFDLDDGFFRQIVKKQESVIAALEEALKARVEGVKDLQELSDNLKGLKSSGSVSSGEVLKARVALAEARAQLADTGQLLKTAQFELDAARLQVERCKVRSPLAGYLATADVAPGAGPADKPAARIRLVPGAVVENAAIVAHVLQLDPIHVVMDYPQDRMGVVSVGQEAEVALDGFPQETFPGRVARVLPAGNPALRVHPVVIELRNPGARIKAGVTGYVRLRRGVTATSVPSTAVIRRKESAVVFCVEDGRAKAREVRLGPLLPGGGYEVAGGLKPGDEVVIFHNFYRRAGSLTADDGYLQDGDRVDTDWRRWSRRE
jgi:HlyD family secretion protein